MSKKNVAVFVSGGGSNLQAIIDAKLEAANIAVVVCNKNGAYAVERAKKNKIPVELVDHKNFDKRKDFEKEIINRLNKYSIDLIVLAGFMRILTSFFVDHFKNKIINLHPSLLPSFPGINAARQALEYGVKVTGCTVHFVDNEVDTGPIIIQSTVKITNNDSEESLLKKIQNEEHKIFPEAVRLFCEGRLTICDRKVLIKN